MTRALKRDSEAITHAAIDMICALMQPMHQDYDLHREQLNKSSLLSTHSFLQALLDMWVAHIVSSNQNYLNFSKMQEAVKSNVKFVNSFQDLEISL